MNAAVKAKIGAKIGRDLTVLGTIEANADEPVYIVWHHAAWCPMACKVFRHFRRAQREADIMAALAHPNTVRFFGVEEPGLLLMEFLEGPTLSRLIDRQKRERLSISNAVRVAIHLGAALEHIHHKGFLHLDMKPLNVIVTHGRPVLYDFGSARRQNAERPPHIAGTDPYIAPEECERGTVTPAADVFGLGVTLYEMLTGELPFAEGTRKNPFPQVARSALPLRRRRPDAPKALDDLVLACLARDAADRPRLPVLLPALHEFIRRGRAMWPTSFQPNGALRAAT
jgi:serine/threonine protein kinase